MPAAVDEDEHAVRDQRQLASGGRVFELILDPPGNQPQRELAQSRQVRFGEDPLERDPGSIRRVDVAVLHALSERMGAHVDEFDLVRGHEELVGEALVDRSTGDLWTARTADWVRYVAPVSPEEFCQFVLVSKLTDVLNAR
jgi:hypothetical protein